MPKPTTSSAKSPSSTGSPRKKRPATKKGGNADYRSNYRKVAKNEHDSAPPPAQPSCMRRSDLCVGLVFLLLAAALAVVYVVGGAPADQLGQQGEHQGDGGAGPGHQWRHLLAERLKKMVRHSAESGSWNWRRDGCFS